MNIIYFIQDVVSALECFLGDLDESMHVLMCICMLVVSMCEVLLKTFAFELAEKEVEPSRRPI